jgi:transaldolase
MKIYLATADTQEIGWASDCGFLDGVVASPAILTRESEASGRDPKDILTAICEAVDVPVCAAVESVNAADAYRLGRDLAKISDQIVVAVPLVEDTLGALRRLRAEGVKVTATLIYTTAQAALAAKAGASVVSIGIDHLDLYGIDGADVVRETTSLLLQHGFECDVMAWCPRGPAQFGRCARAGADILAVEPQLLHALLVNPLTDRGVDRFLAEIGAES